MSIYLIICVYLKIFTSICIASTPLSLTLIHINDLHSKYEPVTAGMKSDECTDDQTCVGGYARVVHAVRALKKKYHDYNPVYINAGDNFQGTVFYGFLRWNVTQAMLNLEPPNLMTLGNHEFDHGVTNLAMFMNRIKWPVVCANIDTRDEPEIDGRVTETLVREFHVRGQKTLVGFIGALDEKTRHTTNVGKVKFESPLTAVRREAERLKNIGVHIIIVVSHCGFNIDLEIAEKVGDLVDVVIGSHSHTLLWPKYNKNYPFPNDIVDDYPKIVYPKIAPHRKVLVVQAFCHGKIVGALKVDFDHNGEVEKWISDPVYLSENYPKDPDTSKMVEIWKEEVLKVSKKTIGSTKTMLHGKNCRWEECTLGNFIAKVFRKYYSKDFPNVPILSMIQAASFRGDIVPQEITEGDLMRVFPYDSTVDVLDLEGKHIRRSLEKSAILDRKNRYNLFQISGFRVAYNMSKPDYGRIVSLEVRTGKDKYEPLKDDQTYKVVTLSFIANGGDNFTELSQNKKNHKVGLDSKDVIKQYLEKKTVVADFLETNVLKVLSCPYCDEKKV